MRLTTVLVSGNIVAALLRNHNSAAASPSNFQQRQQHLSIQIIMPGFAVDNVDDVDADVGLMGTLIAACVILNEMMGWRDAR